MHAGPRKKPEFLQTKQTAQARVAGDSGRSPNRSRAAKTLLQQGAPAADSPASPEGLP